MKEVLDISLWKVIEISTAKAPEERFAGSQYYNVVAANRTTKIDWRNSVPGDFSFFLIHPTDVVDNLRAIENQLINAKIFLYLHIGDPVTRDQVKGALPSSSSPLIRQFHHGGEPIERFLTEIAKNHGCYEEEFRMLVEQSLKRIPNQHLKALLILTAGFLAVQKPDFLPCFVRLTYIEGKRVTVMQKKWWAPALGDDFKATDLTDQLKARGRENVESIRTMIEKVSTLGSPTDSFSSEPANGFAEVIQMVYKDLKDMVV